MNTLLIDIGGGASESWEVLCQHFCVERVVIRSDDFAELRKCIENSAGKGAVFVAGGTGMGKDSSTAREIERMCEGRMLEGIANEIYDNPFHTGVAGLYNNMIVVTIPSALSIERASVLKDIVAELLSSMKPSKPCVVVVDFKGNSESAKRISDMLSQTYNTSIMHVNDDVELSDLLTSQSPSNQFILIPGNDGLSPNHVSADVILQVGRQIDGLASRMYPETTIHRAVSALVGTCVVSHVPVDIDQVVLREVLLDTMSEPVEASAELREVDVTSRPRKSPFEMIDMEIAHRLVEEQTPRKSDAETIHISTAVGRVLAEAITAPLAHPPFNASIKDGYAICADDFTGDQPMFSVSDVIGTAGASEILSQKLDVKGASGPVAYRVSTGAAIPACCDTVIQVENTRLVKESKGHEDVIQIIPAGYSINRWQDIRKEGSDIQKGSLLIPAHSVLQPGDVGLLASMGMTHVNVKKSLHIVIMSTGNEIVSAEVEDKLPSKVSIFDSNRSIISAVLDQQFSGRYTLTDLGIVPDSMDDVKDTFNKAMNLTPKPDIVITSGGVSMGEKDYVKTVISSLPNSKTHFQRISMKPGKPTTFVTCDGTAIFGLPGNPVSCLVCCHLFCVPAIKIMLGYPLKESRHSIVNARLNSAPIKLDTERPEYHRVTVVFDIKSSSFVASSTGRQISSRLLSMREANALLHLPKGCVNRPYANPGDVYKCTLIGSFRTE